MIKSNFLKKDRTAATFWQNFNDFWARLQSLKNWRPDAFSKIHTTIRFHPAVVNHPHFLMGFNHLSSTTLQIETIFVQLPMIDIYVFWDFQNDAKNGDNVQSL